MEIEFGIEFILDKHYSLVDGILQSRSFYLQSGKIGDKVSQFKNDYILVEVPNTGVDKKWNELILNTLKKKYRRIGASKKEILLLAREQIKKMREVWNTRVAN
jgi:hypothetical protein